jgi:hypothetical protein
MLLNATACVVIVIAACSQAAVPASTSTVASSAQQQRAPHEYLVTLSEGADARALADVYGRFGILQTKSIGNNVYLLKLRDDPGPQSMEELVRGDARIKAVQPNFIYRINRSGM